MLSWKTNDEGIIEIKEIEGVEGVIPDNTLLAPFSPVTAALVGWAKEKGLEVVTLDPLLSYNVHGVRHASFDGVSPAAYVEMATFHDADGAESKAVFNDQGRPIESINSRNALETGENGNVERIVLTVQVIDKPGQEHSEMLDVDWLVWQASNWSLRFSIARTTEDAEAAAKAISEVCAQTVFFGGDSDTDYVEILGFEANRELELAYVGKNIERRAHKLKGDGSKLTYPQTVKAAMELLGLTNDDIEAYLEMQGYRNDYDPNRVILVDENYVGTIIALSQEIDPSDFEVEAVTNMLTDRFEDIDQEINELILECYQELTGQ